jgi:hypothetical protein
MSRERDLQAVGSRRALTGIDEEAQGWDDTRRFGLHFVRYSGDRWLGVCQAVTAMDT